jgi:hypothetical protein
VKHGHAPLSAGNLLRQKAQALDSARLITSALAKVQDGFLQCRHAGKAQRLSRSIEPAILPGEGSDTLAEAVRLSRPAGENYEAGVGDLKHRAKAIRPACNCGAKQVAFAVGDQITSWKRAIAAGYNFGLLLRWLERLLRALMRMLLAAPMSAQNA